MTTATAKTPAYAAPDRVQFRRRVYQAIEQVGPLSVAGIVARTGLNEDDARRAAGELWNCVYLTRHPGDDGQMRYHTGAIKLDDATCTRRLRQLERDRQLRAEMQAAASPSTSRPAPPAASTAAAVKDPPAHASSPTSQAAARSVNPAHRESQQRAIVAHIRAHGDATRDELAVALDMDLSSVCPRVDELLSAGVLRETTRKRKTRRGRAAVVLELARKQPSLF